jgi:WD40 repeat protein
MKSPFLSPLLVSACVLIGPLAHSQNVVPLAIVREDVAPLILAEPAPDPLALIGWLGSPRHRPQSEMGPALFHPDGRHFLAYEYGENDNHYLSLWKPQPNSAKLTLSGTYPLSRPWNLSGNGQYLCGVTFNGWNRPGTFGVWQFPNGEPVWQIAKDHAAVVHAAAFSQDGRVLCLLWKVADQQQMTILETATGKVIREISLPAAPPINRELPTTMVFGSASLLLSPSLDEKGRLIEIPFTDWIPRFHTTSITDTFHSEWEADTRLDLSRDGKWLVVWSSYRCLVMEFRSGKWTPKLLSDEEWCALGDDIAYHTVAITPDSKRVLVSGGGRHRVVELASGKVLSHDPSGCRCGVFHPAGRLFVRTCYPLEVDDATSFAPLPGGEVSGHTDAIEEFDFMDGGAKIISTSEQFAHVWDLSGPVLSSEPLTRLILPPKASQWAFARLAAVPSVGEIQGGDSFDFFRWKLPADVRPWPKTIVGEFAYRGHESNRDMGLMMSVFPTPDGKSAIYHSNTGPFILRTLDKDPTKVSSHPLAFKSQEDMTGEFRYHFMPDSKSFIYDSYGGIARYDLTTDQITKVKRAESTNLAGHSLTTGRIAGFSTGTLVLYDDKTLATLSKTPFSSPQVALHFKRADFSSDGKWLACVAFDMRKGTDSLWLIDVAKLELVATQLIQPRTSDRVKFSPDSQRLFVGHFGGSISVWDVAKLAVTAPPSAETKAAATPHTATAAATTSKLTNAPVIPPNGYQTFTEVPAKPLFPDKVTPWVWSPDCSVRAADGALQIGTLKINGQPVEVLSSLGNTRAEWETLSGKLEMQAHLPNDQALLISRDVFCDASGSAYWADRLRNPTSSIQQIEVAFEFGFSRDLTELETGQRTPLVLEGDLVRLPPEEEFIVSHLTKAEGKRHTSYVRVMIIGTEGLQKPQTEAFFIPPSPAVVPPESEPELRWDKARRVFQAVHKVTLGPFEHKLLLHTGRSVPTPEGTTLNELSARLREGLTVSTYRWFYPESIELALNYATPISIWLAKESSNNPFYRPPTQPKDQFGFTWGSALGGQGLSNQLILKRGLDPYVDGWPLVTHKGEKEEGFRLHRASRQGDVCIAERTQFTPTLGYRVESRVRYDGDTARKVEVTFVNLLRHPVGQILNDKGNVVPLDRTLPLSALGRKFAIVGKSEDQPCALFSLGAQSENAAPMLRFIDHQTLEIVYVLPMKPGEKIDLLHITAQQPLSAFPTAAEMMAQWPPP